MKDICNTLNQWENFLDGKEPWNVWHLSILSIYSYVNINAITEELKQRMEPSLPNLNVHIIIYCKKKDHGVIFMI